MSIGTLATPTPRSAKDAVAHIGPNWFASVMGTGIVANATATLPVHVPGIDLLARVMWILASTLLGVVLAATAAHWMAHPDTARGHLAHPVMGHFYGAPAMALMTVAAGSVLVGDDVLGPGTSVALGCALWAVGTLLGLWTMVAIPRRTLRGHAPYAGAAFGGWLMPVVPPMVSASVGAILVPHLAPSTRPVMLVACYAMFAVALAAGAPLAVLIVRRAVSGRLGAPVTVPTLFIVLGPLGQSVTAAHGLGDQAGGGFVTFGLVFGLPVMVLALAWMVVAVTITARTLRTGLPFGLTWWSFTFPVGTVATGLSGLAATTGSDLLAGAAVATLLVLLAAWVVTASLTARGVWTRELLRAP